MLLVIKKQLSPSTLYKNFLWCHQWPTTAKPKGHFLGVFETDASAPWDTFYFSLLFGTCTWLCRYRTLLAAILSGGLFTICFVSSSSSPPSLRVEEPWLFPPFAAGFLNHGTIHGLVQIVLHFGGCPVYFRMFGGIPDFCLLEPLAPHPPSTSASWMPQCASLVFHFDNQRCLQTLSNVLWAQIASSWFILFTVLSISFSLTPLSTSLCQDSCICFPGQCSFTDPTLVYPTAYLIALVWYL